MAHATARVKAAFIRAKNKALRFDMATGILRFEIYREKYYPCFKFKVAKPGCKNKIRKIRRTEVRSIFQMM